MALDRRAAELMVQGRDLPWLLRQWVKRTPDKPFLIWAPRDGADRTWTYAEFDAEVRRCASGFANSAIGRGDRVYIHLENCPELLVGYFACAILGAVAVLGNPRWTVGETGHAVRLADPAAVLVQRDALRFVEPHADRVRLVVVTGAVGIGERPSAHMNYQDLIRADPFREDRPVEPMLDLRVQFTSGSTSTPKGVVSTHANTIFAAQQTAYAYGLRQEDVCQLFVPLSHNNGMAVLAMGTLWVGGTIVLQPKFSASEFWPTAIRYDATWASLPGQFFLRALEAQAVPEHSFRFWYVAVLPEIERHYRVQTRGHWGMTETITLPLVGDPFHEGPPLNIGRPAPGNEIAIRREDGMDCSLGETGRLYVRGVRGITLFKEYLNDPEANAASFDANGWFDTGDLVHLDSEGAIFFAGRIGDVLRVGGENVAAAEIETAIMSSGLVRECAVVGKPDDMLDETPVAFVVPVDDARSNLAFRLEQHCAGLLADFKRIREFHIVDDLPRSGMGKILRPKLREMLLDRALPARTGDDQYC